MVARYGNFVTYDPPLTPLTILLWVLPATAIAIGGWAIVARSRRRVRIGLEAFSAGRAPESKPAGPWVYIPGAVIERHINQTEQRLTHGDPAAEAPG